MKAVVLALAFGSGIAASSVSVDAQTCAKPFQDATMVNPANLQYSEAAKTAGLGAGTVVVRVVVAPSGAVAAESIIESSGNPYLDRAAIVAARESTYSPKIVNCAATFGDFLYRVMFDPGSHGQPISPASSIPTSSKPSYQRRMASSKQNLLEWANALSEELNGPVTDRVRTSIGDHFGPMPYTNIHSWRHALAHNGRLIETAGDGSYWVYDPVHHIAASSQSGDLTGDLILYSQRPPARVPTRDLSHIVSSRGLRLGITPALAARALGVPQSAVKRVSARESILYVRKNRMCGPSPCAHDATVIFRNNRAISIALYDLAP